MNDKLKKLREGLDEIFEEERLTVKKDVSDVYEKKIDSLIKRLTDFFIQERKDIDEKLMSKYITEVQSGKTLDEIHKSLTKLLDFENLYKEVVVKNPIRISDIKIPAFPTFPKEMKISNLPKSDTNLVVKAIGELIARFKTAFTTFITNKSPDDAIPVRLVDALGKTFYNARGGAASGGGVSIDLSTLEGLVRDQLQDYFISDKDDDASPNYYGFVKKDGNWYILKETVSAGADTYRYFKGVADYATNWTNRVGLSYDYFHNIF
jgi:hypothetical protein